MSFCRHLFKVARKALLGALAIVVVGNTPAIAQTTIFENNFDSRTAGPYTDDDLDADFNEPNFNNGVTEGRVSVVSGSIAFGGSGSALATTYPEGEDGPRETGAQWRLAFDESYDEATLSYQVRFGAGFDFVRGGKLPGLAGGTSPTGSTQATGFNGWAGRLMWRTSFNGVSGQPEQLTSGGITYAKYTDSGFSMDGVQEDRNPFTNPDGTPTTFVPERWYKVTQRIVMNTPGEFNGIQQVWIDDVLVINEQNLRYRLSDDFAIDQMYFSTFYGGNEDWRTSKDEIAYFDDFLITVPSPTDGGGDPPPPTGGPLLVPGQFPTIAAAVEAASDGDVIQLSGTVSGSVVINKSVCIEGTGGSTVVQSNNPNGATIIVDAGNVILKDFAVQEGRQGVLIRAHSEHVELNNLFVRDTSNVGILVQQGCDGLVINNTEIRESASDGVRITGCDNITLTDNYSQRNTGHGFRLNSSNFATFTANRTFLNNLHGYDLQGDDHSLTDNLSIRNNLRGYAIEGANHFLFDNLAKGNGSHGFSFDHADNCNVIDNRSRFNGGNGFRIWNTSFDNLLDDNNVTGNGTHGLLIGGDSSSNTVTNSFIFENGSSGILLNSTSMENSVSTNVIRSNDGFGIGDFGNNQVADDNILRDNGQ